MSMTEYRHSLLPLLLRNTAEFLSLFYAVLFKDQSGGTSEATKSLELSLGFLEHTLTLGI